jgi:type III secretory pathway component EscR
LAVLKSNLEAFLLSLGITTIYFYSIILLNALQVQQIQKNLIKTILLVCVFNYLLPLLLFIVIKGVKKSEVKIQNRTEQQQQQKKEKKGKKVVKEKKLQRKKINTFK